MEAREVERRKRVAKEIVDGLLFTLESTFVEAAEEDETDEYYSTMSDAELEKEMRLAMSEWLRG